MNQTVTSAYRYTPSNNLYVCVLHSLAVDFTHEALRLLEEEPETTDNAVRLKDDKAQVLLWLYICTLEKNLQTVRGHRVSL